MEPLEILRKIRIEKLERIEKAGINPYPSRFDRTHTINKAKKLSLGNKVKIAGRII